jgi:hypothetical protein
MGDALIAIILFSMVGLISNSVAYIYLLKLSGVSILKPIKIVFNYLILSMPFIITILLIQKFFSSNFLIIVLSLMISVIYYLLIIKTDPEILETLKNITSQVPIINNYL